MIKKWAVQGITDDIDSIFGTNAETIVESLKEEIGKIVRDVKVTFSLWLLSRLST